MKTVDISGLQYITECKLLFSNTDKKASTQYIIITSINRELLKGINPVRSNGGSPPLSKGDPGV